jgi:hypothetical protein
LAAVDKEGKGYQLVPASARPQITLSSFSLGSMLRIITSPNFAV